MATIKQLKEGQRVEFYRRHDKAHKLTGTVTEVNDDAVIVKSDAANGSISCEHDVHPNDCTVIAQDNKAKAW